MRATIDRPKTATAIGLLAVVLALTPCGAGFAAEQLLPRHITPKTQDAIRRGLDYLAKAQAKEGDWSGSDDGRQYPCSMAGIAGMAFLANGNTTTRGPYADNVRRTMDYLVSQANPGTGLISSRVEYQGRSMYGHGFGLLFLAASYGAETDEKTRTNLKKVINDAIQLTARGQSRQGGWTYVPGGGDEGSVTVTQIQALRACQNAGFSVPKGTIEAAIKYLEACRTPEGGICYSFGSGGGARLPISAAAIATLYNAGEYESKLADDCMNYVLKEFDKNKNQFSKGGGHDYYTHLYAAEGFYQAGDKIWDDYFPPAREQLLKMQEKEGSWSGDGVGPVYATGIALTILQLPYKFLPIYQR